jgi:diguanylate cyclase (GGDEF)-like protein
MTPAKPPQKSRTDPRPAQTPVAAVPVDAAPALSLGLVGLLLGLAALIVAAASAYGLALLLGAPSPWAAGLAAALGVVAASVPLAWLMLRLARDVAPVGDRTGTGQLPSAGVALPLFMDLAEREWARARRYGSGAAILLVEVDRFARLVEARGPAVGDAVLGELLRQTAPTLRTADVLTRFSDTQMAVFLAQADATGALDVAERIRERSEQLEVPLPPQRLRVTVSVGVAHVRPAHLNLRSLIDDVEDALAAARQAGGNCVRAAPVESGRLRLTGTLRTERRAQPKQDGSA